MADIKISCPHCGFSRDLPPEKIPDRSVRVICPRCRQRFSYPADTVPPTRGSGQLVGEDTGPGEPGQTGGERPGQDTPASDLVASAATDGPTSDFDSRPVFRDILKLFRDSWDVYLQRIGTLMGLYLVSVGLMLAPVALFGGMGVLAIPFAPDFGSALVGAGVLTGCVVGSFGLFWGIAGLVCAVADRELGIRAALGRAGERFWSFLWVFSLVGYLISGGFLLFIVPGVIFSIWFAFGQFILADEDVRGMNALLKSKAYTSGAFFEVLARLFLIWIASSLLGMVPIAGPFLSVLVVPYMMIFTYLVYVDLRAGRMDSVSPGSVREKAVWLLVGTLGFIVVPAGGLLLFGVGIMQSVLQLIAGM